MGHYFLTCGSEIWPQIFEKFVFLQRPYMAKFLRCILPSSDCFQIGGKISNGKPSPEAYAEV